MVTRFRLPYTEQQVYMLLHEACRAEVEARQRKYIETDDYKRHLMDISKWLTSQSSTFGLFLCGTAGNGKTTIIRALQNLIGLLRSDESFREHNPTEYPKKGFIIVSAKDLVLAAKAYNNPTKENEGDVYKYKRYREIEILAIDDLGQEPKESIHYGDYVTAAIDILSHRYNEQLCTLVSSNLTPKGVSEHYDERIGDRFREMMYIVNFGTEKSFRNLTDK